MSNHHQTLTPDFEESTEFEDFMLLKTNTFTLFVTSQARCQRLPFLLHLT